MRQISALAAPGSRICFDALHRDHIDGRVRNRGFSCGVEVRTASHAMFPARTWLIRYRAREDQSWTWTWRHGYGWTLPHRGNRWSSGASWHADFCSPCLVASEILASCE